MSEDIVEKCRRIWWKTESQRPERDQGRQKGWVTLTVIIMLVIIMAAEKLRFGKFTIPDGSFSGIHDLTIQGQYKQ